MREGLLGDESHVYYDYELPYSRSGAAQVVLGRTAAILVLRKISDMDNFTHKIAPNVDEERDFLLRSLEDARAVETRFYFTPQDAVVEARNASGDPFRSDGRVLVIILK